jgi:hypothetical protein
MRAGLTGHVVKRSLLSTQRVLRTERRIGKMKEKRSPTHAGGVVKGRELQELRAPVDPHDWRDSPKGPCHECLVRSVHLSKREIELTHDAADLALFKK